MNNRISGYWHIDDELDRPTIQDPDEEPTDPLLDDLLESSDSVFHAEVTQFQMNQQKRLEEHADTLCVWGRKQFEDCLDRTVIENAIETELDKFRQMLRYETRQYMRILAERKRVRDEAIGYFSLNQRLIGSWQ